MAKVGHDPPFQSVIFHLLGILTTAHQKIPANFFFLLRNRSEADLANVLLLAQSTVRFRLRLRDDLIAY